MATSPHPDLPRILKALTLMTWELLGCKTWSFKSATSRGLGGAASWSPLLQSRAPSLLAWGGSWGAGHSVTSAFISAILESDGEV